MSRKSRRKPQTGRSRYLSGRATSSRGVSSLFITETSVLNSRFISASWDWFGIGENGNVSNNGNEPDEPYLTGNAAGCMAAERIAGRAFYAIVISILRTGNAVRKY